MRKVAPLPAEAKYDGLPIPLRASACHITNRFDFASPFVGIPCSARNHSTTRDVHAEWRTGAGGRTLHHRHEGYST